MFILLLLLLSQASLERTLLEVEDARAEDATALVEALGHADTHIQRVAVRGLGRLERPELADAVLPLLRAEDPGVRMEAVNALGQMGAGIDLEPFLEDEKDGGVRGVIYETLGRLQRANEALLVEGLHDQDPLARTGAAKGLESFFRLTETQPAPETVAALREAVGDENPPSLRKLALLALNRTGDADPETLSQARKDPDPQVRRLAAMKLETVVDDPSYLVRYESLKSAGTCEEATEAVTDPSGHVALLAVDKLGELGCSPEPLQTLVTKSDDWRRASRALVSLAKVSPEKAREYLPQFAAHDVWQARAYAAAAAKILKNEEVLASLVRDEHPNVIAAALVDPGDAIRVLSSSHYGLLVTAARLLEGWSDGASAVPTLLGALDRVSADKRATSRDPRRQMLLRLREFGGADIVNRLRPHLSDLDPVIAKLAADIISEKVGVPVEPKTLRYVTQPLPAESYILALAGARARIKMKEAGTFALELLPDEAPVTVATFAQLAEKGYYNGLTFHRIVPNFVIQGGSPGANEYVGTADYIRDELGLLSHVRGTVGISTRGRDTGDSQIFINLVDNARLDHNYTVFALVVDGMEAVDAVLEGDVIESIEILRESKNSRTQSSRTRE